MNVEFFKNMVKKKVKEAAFKHLKELKDTHSKISDIKYSELECQPYILSSIFTNEDVNLLHSLRGRSVQCKGNFKSPYGDDISCTLCTTGEADDQPHILKCEKILENFSTVELVKNKVKYDDIFGEPPEQKQVTVMFRKLLEIRKELLDKQKETEDQ